ncbi:MAG: hypothetical protein WCI76_01340 [bacterium]
MKNNFPKIALATSTIFLAFSCVSFWYFYNMINTNELESQSKENEWQNEAKRRDDIKALDHSVKIITEERGLLETHFAQRSDVVPFLDTIEKLATKVGAIASVTSVDISKDSADFYVGMTASGTFDGLYRFLTLLENSPYQLDFSSISLHAETATGAKSSASPKWNATFKIKLLTFIQ